MVDELLDVASVPADDATPEGRQEIIARMRAASASFYRQARATGCHALIEFTGLMNEFIQLCAVAEAQGIDWPHANVHSGIRLPFAPYHMQYLNEKLQCIYGVRMELKP